MPQQIPLVDYLVLGDEPYLLAQECRSCRAHYFDRRSGCASCFGNDFSPVSVSTTGTLTTFTIVSFAAEGVPVPFVAGVVDCDGVAVTGNVVNIEPTYEHVKLGMPLRLTTFAIGTDAEGTEAISFGFEPADNSQK